MTTSTRFHKFVRIAHFTTAAVARARLPRLENSQTRPAAIEIS
jgi:hypothetical protein